SWTWVVPMARTRSRTRTWTKGTARRAKWPRPMPAKFPTTLKTAHRAAPILFTCPWRTATMTEKLQKVLARVGLGSRRELERWIEAGRVSVNGKVATLGDRVAGSDDIRVDGHPVKQEAAHERVRVVVYNKPE